MAGDNLLLLYHTDNNYNDSNVVDINSYTVMGMITFAALKDKSALLYCNQCFPKTV